ncbi:hypothetical protein RclHR1_00150018 [Rhizophagus clarus]|nr:hypothetical protein RclHR1_00150018 [Rhizophagus clarus]
MKVAAARWHALSEEERNDYKKYAADDRTLKQRPIFGIGTSILSPGKDNNESSTILFSDRSASHDLSPEEKFFDYGKYYGN